MITIKRVQNIVRMLSQCQASLRDHSSMLWRRYTRRFEAIEYGWVDHIGHGPFDVRYRAIGKRVERRLSFSKHEARELMR